MSRITSKEKKIAERYIQARKTGSWDKMGVYFSKEDLLRSIKEDGKNYQEVMNEIEARYCTVFSVLASSTLNHTSQDYRAGIYKGFKNLLRS
jgi:hypothetical protein